jgi:hypothetical protein
VLLLCCQGGLARFGFLCCQGGLARMQLAAQTEAQIVLEQQERQKSDADMAAVALRLHSESFAAQQVGSNTRYHFCSQTSPH